MPFPIKPIAVTLCAALSAPAPAQDEPTPAEPANIVTIGEPGSAQDPLAGRDRPDAVGPERAPVVHQVEGVLGVPAMTVQVDPRVLGVAPGEPLPQLRREGEAVRKRDGRLLPTGERGYAAFILDPAPELGQDQPQAMVLAPNSTLESMEHLQADRGDDLRFTVTGEVHTYRGVNYLNITSLPKPWLVTDPPEPEPTEQATETTAEPVDPSEGSAAESRSTDTDSDSDTDATPTSDQVLRDLLNQRQDAPQPIETGPRPGAAGFDAGASSSLDLTDPLLLGLDPDRPPAELMNEGEFLIARTGRLVRSADGAHALFVLDADEAQAPEPPMIMQACKLLEQMEATISEQGDRVPFVVTGQVFVYRGANYLLPTIVRREFERGNLE